MKLKNKITSLALSLVVALSGYTYSNAQQNVEAHFINVGQGDATYIELPDGTDLLIDAGISSKGNTVVDYLKSQEKDMDIEYLIATHPDADHIGGMQEVFKQLNVKNFYYPKDAPSSTQTWNNVLNLAKSEGCNIIDAKSGITLSIGGATIKFVQPNKDYNNNNEDSVVTLLDYNNTEILLTGDAEEQTEKDMISSGLLQDIDILKVGHHGSDSSTTKEFLNVTKPEHAMISVGANNNYGHPTSNVLNNLSSIGSKVWRTDINGNIVVKTDGNNISINDSKGNSFDSESSSSSGVWKKVNGYWYYYLNGTKQTGWIKDAGVWYYLDGSGVMQTGWQKISNRWYYLRPSGAMATGWEKVNGTWYYLESSGAMATGWKQLGDTWYYLRPSGAMATGWEKVNGTWYYLESSGAMATGWKQLGGTWYYLESSGKMKTGWLKDNNKWYYLESNGAMATNTTVDGWYIDGSGVATPIYDNDGSLESQEIVYITPSGKSYHNSRNCTALKRSSTILEVSYSEAINRGKSDPCNLCVS